MYSKEANVLKMTPEEYFHLEELIEKEEWDLKLLKNIEYLPWVLEMHQQGRIRTSTIIEVIPFDALYRCLSTLEELEEYEYCFTVFNLILECYPLDVDKLIEGESLFTSTL